MSDAIRELDEFERMSVRNGVGPDDAVIRAKRLYDDVADAVALLTERGYRVTKPVDPPLAGECDQVAVMVPLTDARGFATVSCPCTVDVVNGQPRNVHFGPGWRRILAAVDVDPDNEMSEGWLYVEAIRVWQRGGGR